MSAEPYLRAFASRAIYRLLSLDPRAIKLAQRAGWAPPEDRVRWHGARTVGEAARALAARAGDSFGTVGRSTILAVGENGPLRRALDRQFQKLGWDRVWVRNPEELGQIGVDPATLSCLIAADVEAARITRTARRALADPALSELPLEYVTGLEPESRQFRAQDEYADDLFVSSLLLAEPSPYRLYNESLQRFEQKCGLRDYLDLYQLLVSVEQRGVPGEVVEFGSYEGHSGWLIGKTLEELGSRKGVHLFDTFKSFPKESAGIDRFWSGTHQVNVEEVRGKLLDLPAVRLVPGEFERTLPGSGLDTISLAYVDCDSHRAVAYLADALFEERLSPGGAMVFEDYGHPALLGCRVAVHEFFDQRTDCVKFYSNFSGLYVVIKLDTG